MIVKEQKISIGISCRLQPPTKHPSVSRHVGELTMAAKLAKNVKEPL